MSIRMMAMVWDDERLSGDMLLLALALADHANDDGQCWPSVTRLAQRIRKSRRQTIRLLKRLEEIGYIHVAKTAGMANHYVLQCRPTSDTAMSPVTSGTSDTAMSLVENVTSDIAMSPVLVTQLCHGTSDIAMSPEPSCNRQLNRHMRGAARASRDAQFLPDAETQAAILFPRGRSRETNADRLLQAAGWELPSSELLAACRAFIDATGIPPPRTKSARRDWVAVLTQHVEEYGTEQLPRLYRMAVERLKGLTISRPGSLTNTLPAVMREGETEWRL